ncbi:hypothetical protein IFM58399_01720 [Aspergillus lentulus]|uniref:Uncharacterized protein n=1 Tax=Aspergillus lentulus TaxID=293939 RepID=A0ABQ1ASA6_ASPLE|nr:uncharacterized protein IFM58399_01720 [Aspergillus lentulus]GFF27529.1 hypothetical protein IFM58399_01720 [Aspergillus lentulus]GFF87166.1 hypothetical protein IFM60648_07954 [Aspergillus lentulus]
MLSSLTSSLHLIHQQDLDPRNSKWPVTTLVPPVVLPSRVRIRLALLVERLALFEFLRELARVVDCGVCLQMGEAAPCMML